MPRSKNGSMRREEARALGDLAGEAAASLASQVRDVHQGVAGRVFGALGMAGGPVRLIHDRASDGAYKGVHKLTAAMVRGGAWAYSLSRSDDDPSLEESTAGRLMVGAINGAWGDALCTQDSPLATKMTVRCRGRDVGLDRDSLRQVFPAPSSRLAIFTHGLCETDDAWKLGASRHVPYGDRLESELGYTSLYVRYNSGLHI